MSSPGSVKASVLCLFSFLVLLCAFLYKKHHDDASRSKLDETLSSLLRVEQSLGVNANAKIAIGYGSCIDVVSSARDLLTQRFGPPAHIHHYDVISSEEELLQTFAYFFMRGAAAEYVRLAIAAVTSLT